MHKLLLADDSVTIQRVIELTFSGEDIHVVAVNDGEQAIARIPIEQPDVVLADIGMPRKGGYDVAAFVKGRPDLAHIPVLLLAGAFEPVDQARAEQVHADGVLIKPFEPRQVIERVKELLASAPERWRGAAVPPPAPQPVSPPVARSEPVVEVLPVPVAAAVVEAPRAPAPWPPPGLEAKIAAIAAGDSPTAVADERPFESGRRAPGQSLDDLFESLNQALAESSKPAPSAERTPEATAAPAVRPIGPVPVPPPSIAPPAGPDFDVLSFEPLAVPTSSPSSVDDYFDRLSAAFAQVKPQSPAESSSLLFDARLPSNAQLTGVAREGLASAALPAQEWMGSRSMASAARDGAESNPILDAIHTLTLGDAEPAVVHDRLGDSRNSAAPLARPDWLDTPSQPTPDAPSDALVEAVTQRVLARLAPAVAESLRDLVEQESARIRREH
jgi:CheY-like chemotaxis protein